MHDHDEPCKHHHCCCGGFAYLRPPGRLLNVLDLIQRGDHAAVRDMMAAMTQQELKDLRQNLDRLREMARATEILTDPTWKWENT